VPAVIVSLAGALLAACSSGAPQASEGPPAPAVTTRASFSGHGSIDSAYVLGAKPGERLVVADSSGQVVGSGVVDRLGSLVVRGLSPGTGYTFRSADPVGDRVAGTAPFRVLGAGDVPPESFYAGQHMHAGLNYITMRDGVKLAATVRLPPGKTLADGPFPTVIEYSGYAIAAPGDLIAAYTTPGGNQHDPLLPDTATVIGSLVAPLLGFASVSLQMRGTGCSGGAFDLFGLNTTYDGYDSVRIVAAQPWVLGHRVGMVGISFSGISQLFVGGARPPGLAAIAPMSVTDDLYSTGFPGGMLNTGFATEWLGARIHDAMPAPQGGQTYAKVLIADGDRQCLANQALHLQTVDISRLLGTASHRVPGLYDVRSPSAWAKKIDVPVFMVGALQDEQTGPQWPAVIPALAHDPDVWVSMINGTHIDSLGPATLSRWLAFLDVFVAHRVPSQPALLDELAPALYSAAVGAPAETPPPVPFTDARNVAAAQADFRWDVPRVQVYFENGGGSLGPGALQPVWQSAFGSWPPAKAAPSTLYLGAGGQLSSRDPSAASASFHPDPSARPATSLSSLANPWAPLPPYDWSPVTGGEGLGFVSPPLRRDLVLVGPASLDLMLRSSAPDTDLQATVSEVYPGGSEVYVTSGFLRASDRALDERASTALHPVPTYLASAAKPLPHGRFTEVRIPIDPIAHAFRAGSRIRITITAPGGDRPVWAFDTYDTGGHVVDTVSLGGRHPSTLVLPVVPGLSPPPGLRACPSLRGEPCRTYAPAGNGG
jgi:predicted acyl esterase